MLPGGGPDVDVAQVRDLDLHDDQLWGSYVQRMRREPGIAITEVGKADALVLAASGAPDGRRWSISGLRDPLAVDPEQVLREMSIDPARVAPSMHSASRCG